MERSGVFLTGCPRTGTTFMARIFDAHGVEFGEAAKGGRGGRNYEDVLFADRSELLINASGGVWYLMPGLIHGEAAPGAFEEILSSRIPDNGKPAGIKDPRLCVTYPCWANQIPRWPVVASIRHPLSMARSLQAMNWQPLERGLATWWRFYTDLLAFQKLYGFDLYWVDYPSMKGMERALSAVGLLLDRDLSEAIFDPSEHHHRQDQQLVSLPHLEALYQKIVEEIR